MKNALEYVGPPAPDLFRRQVGRFGERHYIDPLPADDVWPAIEDDGNPWPSVTTVKKAWPFYAAKKWAAETVAEWAYDNVDSWRNFDRPTAVKLLADQADHSLNRAGKRGSEVHEILDALAAGKDVGFVDPAAEMYLDACRLVVAELKPRWIATETVVISRTLGYGGTFDAVGLVEIEGLGVCIVDWKSRKPGKNGAYPEEGAQVGAYASADYMIVAGPDGNAVRVPLPEIEHGLIVSIDPDGYELHVVDMDIAKESWLALRAFWQAQRTSPTKLIRASRVVGGGETTPAPSPSPAVEAAPPADVERREALIARVKALTPEHLAELAERWPAGVPTFKASDAHSDAQLDAIDKVLTSIDWHPDPVDTPEPAQREEAPAPAPVWTVDEGDPLTEAEVEAVAKLVADLDPSLLSQVNQWAKEAHAADRTFSLKAERNRTQRRFEIMRAAVALSPYDDDIVRAAIGFVMTTTYGDELQPAFTVGQALGSLTIAEASRLAALAEDLGQGTAIVYTDDGVDFVAVAA